MTYVVVIIALNFPDLKYLTWEANCTEFSEGKNLRFQSELRIFQYLIKFVLSQFYRSAKHNTSQQKKTVSRISSANELLPA